MLRGLSGQYQWRIIIKSDLPFLNLTCSVTSYLTLVLSISFGRDYFFGGGGGSTFQVKEILYFLFCFFKFPPSFSRDSFCISSDIDTILSYFTVSFFII